MQIDEIVDMYKNAPRCLQKDLKNGFAQHQTKQYYKPRNEMGDDEWKVKLAKQQVQAMKRGF